MSHSVIARCIAAGSVGLGLCIAPAAAGYVFDPNDFAVQVVSASPDFTGSTLYNDPQAVLGRPTLKFNNEFNPNNPPDLHRVKLVESMFNTGISGEKIITTIPIGSQITVRMGQPVTDDPNNPFGIDFIVFGNDFYIGTSPEFPDDSTDLNNYALSGGSFSEPTLVSVSPDNVNWYTYTAGPYADTPFPTNSYLWNRAGAAWTDVESDPTLPVDPAVASQIAGNTAANVLDLYAGSAGGTGFDLAASGFSSIQYIRFEGVAGFAGGEIDAVARVRPIPEPATAALGVAAVVLVLRRRRGRSAE